MTSAASTGRTDPPVRATILSVHTPNPMRLSPASRLSTRSLEWVAYRNDGSNFNAISAPTGHPATVLAAQFAEVHAQEATDRLPQW